MTDTPAALPTIPPPTRAEQIKTFVGDLARPVAIYVLSISVALGIGKMSWAIAFALAHRNASIAEATMFVTAILAGVGALYGLKSDENKQAAKQAATVAVAQATGNTQ